MRPCRSHHTHTNGACVFHTHTCCKRLQRIVNGHCHCWVLTMQTPSTAKWVDHESWTKKAIRQSDPTEHNQFFAQFKSDPTMVHQRGGKAYWASSELPEFFLAKNSSASLTEVGRSDMLRSLAWSFSLQNDNISWQLTESQLGCCCSCEVVPKLTDEDGFAESRSPQIPLPCLPSQMRWSSSLKSAWAQLKLQRVADFKVIIYNIMNNLLNKWRI